MELYSDLCVEIEMLEERIKDLVNEYDTWKSSAYSCGKKPLAPLDICLEKMESIQEKVEHYKKILERKLETRKTLEDKWRRLKGLDRVVTYKRVVEGKTLLQISHELGLGYDWVRKVNSRSRKNVG